MSKTEWNSEMDAVLIRNYPDLTAKTIAQIIGVSISAIYRRARKLDLKKPEGYVSRIAKQRWAEGRHEGSRKSHFKTGHVPKNKGLKQCEYMTEEAIAKSRVTRFKKGNKPKNHKPIGSERLTKDGYVMIKTKEPNVYELKHRVIWEKQHGPIPEGTNIQFHNGDRTDTRLENLYAITRHDQVNQNTIHRYPSEVKSLIRLSNRLNRKIKNAE